MNLNTGNNEMFCLFEQNISITIIPQYFPKIKIDKYIVKRSHLLFHLINNRK